MHVTLPQLAGPIALSGYIAILALAGFLLTVKGLPWWYQLAFGTAAALAVAGMWLTCLANPGIIPASHVPDPLVQQLESGLVSAAERQQYSQDSRGQWVRRIGRGRTASYSKYCTTCNIWRPPRSHHCSTCEACMEHWDHHCAVVGNCIAARNHRFFAGFLVCGQAGCLLSLGGTIWRLQQRGLPKPGTQWMGTESFLLILAAVVYGYTATVLLFGTMHCLSLVLDITTKDLLTDRQLWRNPPCCPGARSPANLLRSWLMLCCAPTTCRPWQQQQQPQHVWRQLPTAEDALPAEAGGAGGQQEEGTSGSSSGGTGLRMELHESASSIDRHHQQQQPQRPQEEQAGSVSVTVL